MNWTPEQQLLVNPAPRICGFCDNTHISGTTCNCPEPCEVGWCPVSRPGQDSLTSGPCARCGAECVRYGMGGSPWCVPECIEGALPWWDRARIIEG